MGPLLCWTTVWTFLNTLNSFVCIKMPTWLTLVHQRMAFFEEKLVCTSVGSVVASLDDQSSNPILSVEH